MGNAQAVTTIPFWHSMEGELGKEVDSLAQRFNAENPDYKIVPTYKGNYEQNLSAGIAAFRTGNAPAILQVYEVGTATMMASKAIKPVYDVFKEAGIQFDESQFVPTVSGYYSDSKTGHLLSQPFNITARQNLLTQALKQANETVFSLAGRQPEFRGMGTTLVAALIQGDCATVINVGDSRAYRFDGEAMHQISEDHSYVEEMRRRGKITEADARTHPQKNLITRAVGVEPYVEGDLFEVRLNEKDMLLLCSDGLTGMAEDSRIAEVLANAPTLELAGDALLQLALDGGGRDNITVALFTLGKKAGSVTDYG